MRDQVSLAKQAASFLTTLATEVHPSQLNFCLAALSDLHERIDSIPRCLFILQTIAHQQQGRDMLFIRIGYELQLEVLVIDCNGDRLRMARVAVEHPTPWESSVDDSLDSFNERLHRFKDYLCCYGHPLVDFDGQPALLQTLRLANDHKFDFSHVHLMDY